MRETKLSGYVVGNQFYSNDDYHRLFKRGGVKRLVEQDDESVKSGSLSLDQLGSLETKLAAEFPVYHAIAQEIGLTEDLAAVGVKTRPMRRFLSRTNGFIPDPMLLTFMNPGQSISCCLIPGVFPVRK